MRFFANVFSSYAAAQIFLYALPRRRRSAGQHLGPELARWKSHGTCHCVTSQTGRLAGELFLEVDHSCDQFRDDSRQFEHDRFGCA